MAGGTPGAPLPAADQGGGGGLEDVTVAGLAPAPPPAAAAAASPAAGTPGGVRAAKKAKGDTNETAAITITFRAVDLTAVSGQPEANKGIAFDVLKEMQNSPLYSTRKRRKPRRT